MDRKEDAEAGAGVETEECGGREEEKKDARQVELINSRSLDHRRHARIPITHNSRITNASLADPVHNSLFVLCTVRGQ